jgi:hydrogenase maturation protein HypF
MDAIEAAACALRDGSIVMIKGLGGFHLACDATSEAVVLRLRERKARDEKPFAIMVGTLAAAEAIAVLDAADRALLTSVERPIVLVRGRGTDIARAVAPDCSRLGVMLPYTPLHHLLLEETGRALVMTSANLADEPTAYRDDEAGRLLGPVADYLLGHDRRIAARVDDSVTSVIGGAPIVLRRSRGWVPQPILLSKPVPEPILGCGAQLKNTFCIAVDDVAYLGPHIGDLDSLESYVSFSASIERFESMLGVRPKLIAPDMHPDLLSTRYALEREGRRVTVQHHHAHIASAMAEHGLSGPVVGVAFDGTGYGGDGTSWGGEVLVVRRASATRLGTLRPLPLAGGERAIREPWRLALAALDDAFEGQAPLERLGLFRAVTERRIEQVRAVMSAGAPLSHGAGRYFDAVAALLLERPNAAYEAQLAMALEQVADPSETQRYDFELDRTTDPPQVDFRPTLRALVSDMGSGVSVSAMATRFHRTLASATAALVQLADVGLPVVLSGGCFQNAWLSPWVVEQLAPRRVYLQREVPPNDGGIALGQIWVAGAQGEG